MFQISCCSFCHIHVIPGLKLNGRLNENQNPENVSVQCNEIAIASLQHTIRENNYCSIEECIVLFLYNKLLIPNNVIF